MRTNGRPVSFVNCRCDRRLMLTLLISTVIACLFASTPSQNTPTTFLLLMKADALHLLSSTHHQRRFLGSRAPRSGPSTTASPKPEPNTKRRPRESRSVSPLVAFYSMILGRPDHSTKRGDVGSLEEDSFSEDMIQREQEFRKLYENYRGRGRWGGYSLAGIQQESHSKRSPLPVVSTTATSKPIKKTRLRRVPSVLKVTDIQQYKDEVVDSSDSSLVVVRFYAPWCKACKAIESSYHRLPREFPSSVKFVEVPLTKENAYLHKGLGIESLPFAHIYYNDDHVDNNGTGKEPASSRLVEELKMKKNKFSEFKRVIQSYVDKECDVHYSWAIDLEDEDDVTITVAPKLQRRQTSINVTENELLLVH